MMDFLVAHEPHPSHFMFYLMAPDEILLKEYVFANNENLICTLNLYSQYMRL